MRWLKILLAALVSLWGLVGLLVNLTVPEAVFSSVQTVASVPYLESEDAPLWRVTSPVLIWIAVAAINGAKAVAFLLCGFGVLKMVGASRSSPREFMSASAPAIAGCGVAFAMLFGGFIVLGEHLYEMFRIEGLALAGELAFRYAGAIGIVMIFLSQKESSSVD